MRLRVRVPSCQDSGKIQAGSTDIQEYASYTRQTTHRAQTLGYCAPKRTSRRKKRRGSHKQPLWNRSRKIPIPGQPAERPEHSAEGDRNAGFTHVRAYAVASISLGTTGPAAVPVQNPERPERGGDYARRRNETEKGKRPDRSRERTALEEYDEYEQKRSPASLQGSLRRRLPTLPHVTAVPSA